MDRWGLDFTRATTPPELAACPGEVAALAADSRFSRLHFENIAAELAEQLMADNRALDGLLSVQEVAAFAAEDERVMYPDHGEACRKACLPQPVVASQSCQCEDGRFPLRRPPPTARGYPLFVGDS